MCFRYKPLMIFSAYSERVVCCMHDVTFDMPLSMLLPPVGAKEDTMNECKLVQEKETGRWQAVVYVGGTNQVVTASPHYSDKDRAIQFARENFGHLCDVNKLK